MMDADQLAEELIAFAEVCEKRAEAARLAATLLTADPPRKPTKAQQRKKLVEQLPRTRNIKAP